MTEHQLHYLMHEWTYWFDKDDYQQVSGIEEQRIENVFTFETVEHFWTLKKEIPLFSEMKKGSAMYLLKKDISPNGNQLEQKTKLKFLVDKSIADKSFETLALMIIGEKLDQCEFIDGISYSISANARFTIFFSDWDDVENKYFTDDLMDTIDFPSRPKFDLFLKDKTKKQL